jgi:hypothetical protein
MPDTHGIQLARYSAGSNLLLDLLAIFCSNRSTNVQRGATSMATTEWQAQALCAGLSLIEQAIAKNQGGAALSRAERPLMPRPAKAERVEVLVMDTYLHADGIAELMDFIGDDAPDLLQRVIGALNSDRQEGEATDACIKRRYFEAMELVDRYARRMAEHEDERRQDAAREQRYMPGREYCADDDVPY